jgi:hypothetical protein
MKYRAMYKCRVCGAVVQGATTDSVNFMDLLQMAASIKTTYLHAHENEKKRVISWGICDAVSLETIFSKEEVKDA